MALATFGGLQFFSGAESVGGSTLTSSARGSVTFGQKPFINAHNNAGPPSTFNARALSSNRYQAHAVSAQALDVDTRTIAKGQRFNVPDFLPVSRRLSTSCYVSCDLAPAAGQAFFPVQNIAFCIHFIL